MERIGPPSPLRFAKELISLSPRQLFFFIFGRNYRELSDDEFLQYLNEGYSLFRWADGETAIARGKSISYQKSDEKLAEKLKLLLITDSNNLIWGLSWAFRKSIFSKSWSSRNIKVLASTKLFLNKKVRLSNNTKIVETLIWYKLIDNLPRILDCICQNRKTILVCSERKYLEILPTKTKLILAPKMDAFDEYDQILTRIKDELVGEHSLKPLVITSIGPTSKALVLDLHEICQVIDVGHGFSFHFGGAGHYAWREKSE